MTESCNLTYETIGDGQVWEDFRRPWRAHKRDGRCYGWGNCYHHSSQPGLWPTENKFQTPNPPKSQVDDLIKQVAEENGLEVAGQLASVGVPTASLGEATAASTVTFHFWGIFPNYMTWQVQDDPLSRRLAALREWAATCLARFSKHQCLTAHNFGYMWICECDTVKIESYMWYSHTFGSHTCVFCHWSYKSWYLYMIYTPKATVDLVYIHIWKQSFTLINDEKMCIGLTSNYFQSSWTFLNEWERDQIWDWHKNT